MAAVDFKCVAFQGTFRDTFLLEAGINALDRIIVILLLLFADHISQRDLENTHVDRKLVGERSFPLEEMGLSLQLARSSLFRTGFSGLSFALSIDLTFTGTNKSLEETLLVVIAK